MGAALYDLHLVNGSKEKLFSDELAPSKVMLRFQNKPEIQPEEYLIFDVTLA